LCGHDAVVDPLETAARPDTLAYRRRAARALARGYSDSETEDSYSMRCVPNMVPDFSDQLTEAEVAEPGFNGAHAHGGGGHH
jgi:hypothetical protein